MQSATWSKREVSMRDAVEELLKLQSFNQKGNIMTTGKADNKTNKYTNTRTVLVPIRLWHPCNRNHGGKAIVSITKHGFHEDVTAEYIWCCGQNLTIRYGSPGMKWTKSSALRGFRWKSLYSNRHRRPPWGFYQELQPLAWPCSRYSSPMF